MGDLALAIAATVLRKQVDSAVKTVISVPQWICHNGFQTASSAAATTVESTTCEQGTGSRCKRQIMLFVLSMQQGWEGVQVEERW